jgi:hypothetical protein
MRLGLWSYLPQLGDTSAQWDELRMRLQHLALFRGIGLDACTINLVAECPSACRASERLWRLPSDNNRVTVEVVLDFHLRFPNVALRQNRFLRSVNLRKSGDP